MSRYRKFWVWPKRKGEIFGSILANEDFEVAINEHCLENSFQVIELAALEACQKRLDEAVGLLKDSRCYVESESKYYTDSKELCEKIDTFLSHKDEGGK